MNVFMFRNGRIYRNPENNFTFVSMRQKLNHYHSVFAVSCFLSWSWRKFGNQTWENHRDFKCYVFKLCEIHQL